MPHGRSCRPVAEVICHADSPAALRVANPSGAYGSLLSRQNWGESRLRPQPSKEDHLQGGPHHHGLLGLGRGEEGGHLGVAGALGRLQKATKLMMVDQVKEQYLSVCRTWDTY